MTPGLKVWCGSGVSETVLILAGLGLAVVGGVVTLVWLDTEVGVMILCAAWIATVMMSLKCLLCSTDAVRELRQFCVACQCAVMPKEARQIE